MAHQIDESKPKYLSQTRFMSGRRIIKTSVTEITDENVVDVLRKALATHELNRSEIDYLWKYYRGDQPIRNRVKDVRPEICNKITENRANEIVSFKVGYLCGEPIQYVSRNGGEEIVKQMGYEEKLADATAEAMADGDTEKVFANQKKHLENVEKKVRAEALKDTPKPTPDGDSKTMTLEKLRKMSPQERYDYSVKNPEDYKALYTNNDTGGNE